MISAFLTAVLVAGGGPGTDFIYNCEDAPVVIARFLENALELRIGTRELVFPQGRSGSGARYTDGSMVFWIKGRDATLDTGDGVPKKCHVTGRG